MGIWAALLKFSVDRVGTGAAFALSNLMSLPLVVWILTTQGLPKKLSATALPLLAGVAGVCGMLAYLKAMRVGPAVLAIGGSALYPAVTMILLWSFGERVTGRQVLGLVLACMALILLAVPTEK